MCICSALGVPTFMEKIGKIQITHLGNVTHFPSFKNTKYADNNTMYSTGKNLNKIKRNLEIDFMILH